MKVFTENLGLKNARDVKEITKALAFNAFKEDKLVFISGYADGAIYFDELTCSPYLLTLSDGGEDGTFVKTVKNSLVLRHGVTDISSLKSAEDENEKRTLLFNRVGVKNIGEYNVKFPSSKLPFAFAVIEFSKENEGEIKSLVKTAYLNGVHILLRAKYCELPLEIKNEFNFIALFGKSAVFEAGKYGLNLNAESGEFAFLNIPLKEYSVRLDK